MYDQRLHNNPLLSITLHNSSIIDDFDFEGCVEIAHGGGKSPSVLLTYLSLDWVELRDAVAVDPLELLVPERGHGQRLQVEQLGGRHVLLREDEMPESISGQLNAIRGLVGYE